MLLSRKELKIFLTFFIIYSFFVYWSTWNEESRFALTRAIVNEKRFEIDSYANQTGDRSFYNGHYYSDKDPEQSLLATPTYWIWKFIYYNFFPSNFIKTHSENTTYVVERDNPIVHYINPGFFTLVSIALVTIFTSSLLSALTVMLIYKILKYFTKNEKLRLLTTFTYGLGTLAFPYAIVFIEHSITTFLGFFSFFLLFKSRQEKIDRKSYFYLSGLIFGIAITSNAITVFLLPIYLVYLLYFNKRKSMFFVIGILLGVLPFLLYNYFIFNTIFTLPRYHLDLSIWSKIYQLGLLNLFVVLRLMFYPYNGLFFFYPILAFSFIGFYYMYKEFKIETLLFIIIFIIYLLLISSWWAWWGGLCFGPRQLLPIVPFITIPLIYSFKKINLKFLMIFVLFSIFVNFVGLQTLIPFPSVGLDLTPAYKNKVNSFEILANPIFENYIPLFLKNGPRSRIFESLLNLRFDIRHWSPQFGEEDQYLKINEINLFSLNFIGKIMLRVPFLCLIPILLIILLIWSKDLFEEKEIKNWLNKRRVILLSLLILLIFFLLFINIE